MAGRDTLWRWEREAPSGKFTGLRCLWAVPSDGALSFIQSKSEQAPMMGIVQPLAGPRVHAQRPLLHDCMQRQTGVLDGTLPSTLEEFMWLYHLLMKCWCVAFD